MYDVHFKFSKEKELELLGAGKPLEAHFRFYSISEEAGRKMLDQAVWDPKLQLPGARRLPLAVDIVSDFEPSAAGLHPTGSFSSETARAECTWDSATGYQSKASLSDRCRRTSSSETRPQNFTRPRSRGSASADCRARCAAGMFSVPPTTLKTTS